MAKGISFGCQNWFSWTDFVSNSGPVVQFWHKFCLIGQAGLILGGDRFWQNGADLPLQFVGSGHPVSMSNSCQRECQRVVTLQVFYNKTCCITAYIYNQCSYNFCLYY